MRDHRLTRRQRTAAAVTITGVLLAGIVSPVAAAGIIDSGFTCGKTSFITWSWGIPTKWYYRGTTGNGPAAHKHRFNGDRFLNGTIDYWGYQSRGWCADAH